MKPYIVDFWHKGKLFTETVYAPASHEVWSKLESMRYPVSIRPAPMEITIRECLLACYSLVTTAVIIMELIL